MAETKTATAPGLGYVAPIMGAAAGGYAGIQQNRANKSYVKGLDYFKRTNINPLLAPLQESLYGGLAPGGLLRQQMAGEGTFKGFQESANALAQARAGGTRTSARAQELSSIANALRSMAMLQSQGSADIGANAQLAGMRLNEMGASDALKPTQYQQSSWLGIVQGLGRGIPAGLNAQAVEDQRTK